MRRTQQQALIDTLAQVGEAMYRTVGPQCEVVIHDLADMEHSIVWIMGNVTGRQVGGCMTSRGLSLVRSGRTSQTDHYTTRTREGKTVRSSQTFIKDKQNRPAISVEFNFDTSPFVAFRHALESLADPDEAYDFQDAFLSDAPEMLESLLQKAVALTGKPVSQMSKADRKRVVQVLDEAGAMELRKAIPTVASYLGVTRFTIHNYVNEIRQENDSEADERPGD